MNTFELYCVHVLGISGIGSYINVYEIRVQEERKMSLFVWENINYYFNIILLYQYFYYMPIQIE